MAIPLDEVRRIARLANLELDAAAERELSVQLGSILDYVALLDGADVRDVRPTAVGGATGATEQPSPRPDEPATCTGSTRALAGAPAADRGHFLVPRVLEE